MDSSTLIMNPFATKVSSFSIVIKSCILSEIGFKMNYYLTYFDAESSNAQFLCYFAFPFFKFSIIPLPSCNLFKCARIPTRNGTSLLWNSSMSLVFRIDISTNSIIPVTRRSSNRALESFWHNLHHLKSQSLYWGRKRTMNSVGGSKFRRKLKLVYK